MYVRPQGYRYPEGVRLPKNYGGSAFSEPQAADQISEEAVAVNATEEPSESPPTQETESAQALLRRDGQAGIPSMGIRSIGSEELLLFALILLLSDSEIGDDLVLFLILLFFIK